MPLLEQVVDGFFPELPVVTRVLVDAGENGVHGVRLELRGDRSTWGAVRSVGRFGYAPDVCGPIFGGAFREDLPYWITVGLVEPHVAVIAALAPEPAEACRVVVQPGAPWGRTDAWVLLSVMQPRSARVQWGMTTTFLEGR